MPSIPLRLAVLSFFISLFVGSCTAIWPFSQKQKQTHKEYNYPNKISKKAENEVLDRLTSAIGETGYIHDHDFDGEGAYSAGADKNWIAALPFHRSPSPGELVAVSGGKGALQTIESGSSSCFRDAARQLRVRCEEVEMDEAEKVGYALRLSVCEFGTANLELPRACASLVNEDNKVARFKKAISPEDNRACVEVLAQRTSMWTTYSGNLRAVTSMCFAVRHHLEREAVEQLFSNLTQTHVLNTRLVETHTINLKHMHHTHMTAMAELASQQHMIHDEAGKVKSAVQNLGRKIDDSSSKLSQIEHGVKKLETEQRRVAEAIIAEWSGASETALSVTLEKTAKADASLNQVTELIRVLSEEVAAFTLSQAKSRETVNEVAQLALVAMLRVSELEKALSGAANFANLARNETENTIASLQRWANEIRASAQIDAEVNREHLAETASAVSSLRAGITDLNDRVGIINRGVSESGEKATESFRNLQTAVTEIQDQVFATRASFGAAAGILTFLFEHPRTALVLVLSAFVHRRVFVFTAVCTFVYFKFTAMTNSVPETVLESTTSTFALSNNSYQSYVSISNVGTRWIWAKIKAPFAATLLGVFATATFVIWLTQNRIQLRREKEKVSAAFLGSMEKNQGFAPNGNFFTADEVNQKEKKASLSQRQKRNHENLVRDSGVENISLVAETHTRGRIGLRPRAAISEA